MSAVTVSVDITVIVQVLVGIATVVLPIIAAFVAKEAIAFFHISSDSATAARIGEGVNALSDIALSDLHAAAATESVINVSALVANVLTQCSESMIAAAKRQGTTPEMLASRVTGALIAKASASPPAPIQQGSSAA